MELYRRLARPVLFALPPEGAHHVAQALLRLPLPWRRIGGVERDPMLELDLAGIHLAHPVGLEALLRELAPRKRTPLFVKLPPFRTDVERDAVLAVAEIALRGGADGLTCSNTVPVEEPRLASGGGGLSGGEVLADTLRIVAGVRAVLGADVPINASGGIATARDAFAAIEA